MPAIDYGPPSDNETFPLDPAFIRFLAQRFPERSPDPRDSEREVWMKAGERRVVTWLLFLLRQQEENDVPAAQGEHFK